MRVQPGRPVGYDPQRDVPPARPASMADLGFSPEPAVRWFSPSLLADAGLQVVLSRAFGNYLDKRELQVVLDQEPFTDLSDRAEVWIDYVADTGDGFDATYSVASLVGRAYLDVDGLDETLPRGDLLVLGGDEVYPDATAHGYEHRLEGPLSAALPWTGPSQRPALFATPGNHDWYDGLTSFMRQFCQQKTIGGWQTYQTRSYYAVKLPHGWWLWGVDIQLDTYIDEPQLRFFESLDVAAGDRIILCTAEPTWVDTPANRDAVRNLAYLERHVIAKKGAEAVLTLAGDLHHYAHYQSRDGQRHKITAGGGGAFLHPTHGLPASAPVRIDPDDPASETTYDLTDTYPAPGRSRRLALGTLGLGLRNPSFVLLPAALHLLLTAEVLRGFKARVQGAEAATAGDAAGQLVTAVRAATPVEVFTGVFTSLSSLAVLVAVLLALVGFAKPPRRVPPRAVPWLKWPMGVAHTVLHVVGVSAVAWAALQLGVAAPPGWVLTAITYAAAFVLGGVVGSLLFGVYLAAANGVWDAEGNHAFSAQRLTRCKNFLRLRLRSDGGLDVHAIGVERAWRAWRAQPRAGREDEPWVVPDGEGPAPHLIEQVTLRGRKGS